MADLHLRVLACAEPFEAMRPSQRGRVCGRCTREVVDADALDRRGLEALSHEARTRGVCARFQSLGLAAGLAAGVSVTLAGCATPPGFESPAAPRAQLERDPEPALAGAGVIMGHVRDHDSGEAIENALVVIQSRALPEVREHMTNARGLYTFVDLPPGTYTVQVLKNNANVSKIMEVEDKRYRIDFSLEPDRPSIMGVVVVDDDPVPMSAESSMRFEFGNDARRSSGRAHPVDAPRTKRE